MNRAIRGRIERVLGRGGLLAARDQADEQAEQRGPGLRKHADTIAEKRRRWAVAPACTTFQALAAAGIPRSPSPGEAILTWLLGIALFVAVGFGIAAVATSLAISEGLTPEAAFGLISDPVASPLVTSPAWISAGIALNELTVVALMVIWLRRLRAPLGAIVPLARPSVRALLGAVFLPFGFAPLAELSGELMYRVLPEGVPPERMLFALARGSEVGTLPLVLVAAALLPAVVEELMFRGFVTTAFQRYSPLVTVAASSLMFGVFHLEPTQAAGTVVLGAAFGLVRFYTGSIWPCIVSHFAYNAGVLLEARWLDPPADHRIYWGRVGVGLVLAVVAYVLLVGDLGRRFPLRLSFRPPPPRGPA